MDGRQKVLNMETNGTQYIMTDVVAKPWRASPADFETRPMQQVIASASPNRRASGDKRIKDKAPIPNLSPK